MKYREEVINVAAILATVAALFAAVCWITSGKAGGTASDQKTEALGFMILRLESSTEASTARVQAQTYLTQAGMYYAYADKENNENVRLYLENLGNTSIAMSNFFIDVAENAENKAQLYYDAYEKSFSAAKTPAAAADYRSTGALIFNVSSAVASCAVLVKRKEFLYLYLPMFAIGAYHFTMSFMV